MRLQWLRLISGSPKSDHDLHDLGQSKIAAAN